MTQSLNPLRKYFRQPAIHIRLPSNGKFYPPGVLVLPPTGELPIYPMTAVDEIKARTPDALYNGAAVVDIIHSCAPGITDPWQMPATDISALLAAIRLASYGHDMEIGTTCPSCNTSDTITIDLRNVLDSLHTSDEDNSLSIGELTFNFGPMSYYQLNEMSKKRFEDQQTIEYITSSELPDAEKMERLGEVFKRITMLTIDTIAGAVRSITTSDMLVTDPEHINEFLTNCPKTTFNVVRDHTIKIRDAADLKPVAITCPNCLNEYKQEFTLDMSNFFDPAS